MLQELKFPNDLFKLFDQVFRESRKNVKEMQDNLLKEYIKEAINPIVDQIEKNLYAGRFDFRDCSKPISKIIQKKKINIILFIFSGEELCQADSDGYVECALGVVPVEQGIDTISFQSCNQGGLFKNFIFAY